MAIYPFISSAISEDKYLSSSYFPHDSTNSPSVGTNKIPFEDRKPLGPSVLQTTSDPSDAGPFIRTQAKIRSENQYFKYFNPILGKKRPEKKEARDETRYRILKNIC
jgi:hypothetical protein